ncbi:MAG TPA: hypothetical protein VEH31_00200 [Streptosporangiaceae bacterium]|nr:hypothetical protein [Streptosporangiaceae bacterium]
MIFRRPRAAGARRHTLVGAVSWLPVRPARRGIWVNCEGERHDDGK